MVRELNSREADARAPVFRSPARAHPAQVAVAWIIGGLATVTVVIIGSVLAVVFAATLAFVLVLTAAFLSLLTVSWRFSRPRAVQSPVIEARKVGHSWVAYGWDQPS